jgi:hypothetical protein
MNSSPTHTVTIAAFIHRTQSPFPLEFWCVAGFCAGIGLFVYGFRLLQRRRLILDTPFSKIRSASMGMVEITGLAVGPYTMVAPITARPSYYYRTLVWEWKQSGKNKQWVKVAGECMHVPFFVDDNTGRMLVDPRGADLDLHRDFEQEFCDGLFTMKEPAPANVRAFLAKHGVVTNNKIKVEEFCIKPKNALFILGTLTENPGLEVSAQPIQDDAPINCFRPQGFSLSVGSISVSLAGNNHEEFQTGSPSIPLITQREMQKAEIIRLSLQAGPAMAADMTQQQKIAAALVKAGISNPAAWNAAGVTASEAPVVEGSSVATIADGSGPLQPDFDLHPPVVLMKGANNKTFLISWRSQREVARSLGWKCALLIWGGPALALLSLYFFLSVLRRF